jgi:hypothetical protein
MSTARGPHRAKHGSRKPLKHTIMSQRPRQRPSHGLRHTRSAFIVCVVLLGTIRQIGTSHRGTIVLEGGGVNEVADQQVGIVRLVRRRRVEIQGHGGRASSQTASLADGLLDAGRLVGFRGRCGELLCRGWAEGGEYGSTGVDRSGLHRLLNLQRHSCARDCCSARGNSGSTVAGGTEGATISRLGGVSGVAGVSALPAFPGPDGDFLPGLALLLDQYASSNNLD